MFARTMMAIAISVFLSAASVAGGTHPYLQPDETWVSISGTIVSPGDDSFYLDYGEGTILVEMDDWDQYGDAKGLLDGDRVTVHGRVDSAFYENTTIEAGSVYVESLNTCFYANSADEEGDASAFWNIPATKVVTSAVNLRGTVSNVDQAERTFTLNKGNLALTVDTSRLGYNPLDEFGYSQIDPGDQVRVSGYLTKDFFSGRELMAEMIVILTGASGS
ncbi:hypothetical protein KJ682_09650 [bacterium]|nr:hypothetical protein [bacterium]